MTTIEVAGESRSAFLGVWIRCKRELQTCVKLCALCIHTAAQRLDLCAEYGNDYEEVDFSASRS